MALEYAEGVPTRELAEVLVARAAVHGRRRRFGSALVEASRACKVATAAECPVELVAGLVATGVARIMWATHRRGWRTSARRVGSRRRAGRSGRRWFSRAIWPGIS